MRWCFVILLFLSSCLFGNEHSRIVPAGFNTWQTEDIYTTQVGQSPKNYQRDDGEWAVIDTCWTSHDDTLFTCNNAILKTSVRPTGESTITLVWGDHTVTLKQSLVRVAWIDTSTMNQETLTLPGCDSMAGWKWPAPQMSGRDLVWSFKDWQYRIRRDFGHTASQIIFKPKFLGLVNQAFDDISPVIQSRLALATTYKYEIIGLDNADILDVCQCRGKDLLDLGHYMLSVPSQRLHFSGYEDHPSIPVYQEWRGRRGNLYLTEYVMMEEIQMIHNEMPNADIWHAAGTTIINVDVEDAWIENDNVCYNHGANEYLYMAPDTLTLIRCFDVADYFGANTTMIACSLFIQCDAVYTNGNVDARRVFKPWVEGSEIADRPDDYAGAGVEWNHWHGYGYRLGCIGKYWATAGCACQRDNGEDNDDSTALQGCSDSTADCKATAEDGTDVSSTGWKAWDISVSLAQGWYDGTINEEGVVMEASGLVSVKFVSQDANYTPNNPNPKPYWQFTYTVGGDEPPDSRHEPGGTGQLHGPDGGSSLHKP